MRRQRRTGSASLALAAIALFIPVIWAAPVDSQSLESELLYPPESAAVDESVYDGGSSAHSFLSGGGGGQCAWGEAAAQHGAPRNDGAAGASSAAESEGEAVRLEELRFVNVFTSELPADPLPLNTPRQVYGAAYSYVDPTPTNSTPRLVACSRAAAALLGLARSECARPNLAQILSGNTPWPGASAPLPYGHCYGGWQFGEWAGQLGDGRAISLGQVAGPDGTAWEVQLKGAGPTPYSRGGDGRAVLLSSLREFVGSEAMAALGVPTSRALALVVTGAPVYRDMLYSFDLRAHPGAVTTRLSRGFLRFGSLQLPAARGGAELGLARQLADYVVRHCYPHLQGVPRRYARWLEEVGERMAALVAEWHRVGFTHGVLNHDNLSLLGETIDYGPFGWMEHTDFDYTPNLSDLPERRYRFRNQPDAAAFGIAKLGEALVAAGLVTEGEAEAAVDSYRASFRLHYRAAMARKLGLAELDERLLRRLLGLMQQDGADYTNTFRALAQACPPPQQQPGASPARTCGSDAPPLSPQLQQATGSISQGRAAAWQAWLSAYCCKLAEEGAAPEERAAMQDAANPFLVPRNHVLADMAAAVEAGDAAPLHRYMAALAAPYTAQDVDPAWLQPAPRRLRKGVDVLSCAS